MTATKAQKIRLGLFAVAAAGATLVVLIVFAGLRFWEQRDSYFIDFEDSVLGLEEGAPVTFGGIKVGTVTSIAIAPDDLRKVRVKIEIKQGSPVRADTTATLSMAGITGLKSIDLHGGDVRSAALPPGSTITVGETTLDRFERQAKALMDQSQELMGHATRVASNLAELTEPANFEGVEEIVRSARIASANLAEATAGLRGIVDENRGAIRRTVASVDQVTARAATMMDQMEREVPALVGDGRELIGEVRGTVRTNGSYLRSAMFDLRQASRNLKEMARDVRQRPSRLFFSKPARERKLP